MTCDEIKGLCVIDTPQKRAILMIVLLVSMMILTLMFIKGSGDE